MGNSCASSTASGAVTNAPCSCIDGRETSPIFGSPGGDAGILLRVAYAYSTATGKQLDADKLKEFVLQAAAALGRPIYFHSDSHAKEHVDITSRVDDEEELFKPQNIGCGYFKLAITDPERLNEAADSGLSAVAKAVYAAICRTMWDAADKVNLVILQGDHKEDGVNVSNSLTKTLEPAGHIFVYHPRKEEADTLLVLGALAKVVGACEDQAKVLSEVKSINERHWKGAIAVLAPGIEHKLVE